MSDGSFRVALTFDAEHPDRAWCPPGNVDRILGTLADSGARATFFVQGRWAESQPSIASRIARDGHLVGNHSFYHARMPLLSASGFEVDVHEAERAIGEATGRDPRPWFRCPFGAGHDEPAIVERLDSLGYRNVFWHVMVEDYEAHRTGAEIATDTIDGVRAHGDGAGVLLHTWPGGTGAAIGPMVDGLRALGATLVGVDELEELP